MAPSGGKRHILQFRTSIGKPRLQSSVQGFILPYFQDQVPVDEEDENQGTEFFEDSLSGQRRLGEVTECLAPFL